VYDGSEIIEAVSMMLSMERHGVQMKAFAPNKKQMHVIDHSKGQPMEGEKRNVLVEASRIVRGNIHDLKSLRVDEFDALFVPGGFGAAKNLSDFAVKGQDMTVDSEVERVLREFHRAQKQIGLCCISPVLAAKIFGQVGLTLGKQGAEDTWPY